MLRSGLFIWTVISAAALGASARQQPSQLEKLRGSTAAVDQRQHEQAGDPQRARQARTGRELANLHHGSTSATQLKKCIIMQDNRFEQEPESDIDASQVEKLRYYEAAYHINRLYAWQQGYTFIQHGAHKSGLKPERHESWMKLQFLRDSLECCCQWAMYMDSDSFFVMRGHTLAVEDWLYELEDTPRMSTLLGNMYPVSGMEVRAGYDPVAVVADNWEYSHYSKYCAGVQLFTRTKRSFEILDYWFNTTAGLNSSTLLDYPWEQMPLNDYVMPEFPEAFYVAPGVVVNSRDGEIIRHLWSPYGEELRTNLSRQHLKEVLQQGKDGVLTGV